MQLGQCSDLYISLALPGGFTFTLPERLPLESWSGLALVLTDTFSLVALPLISHRNVIRPLLLLCSH